MDGLSELESKIFTLVAAAGPEGTLSSALNQQLQQYGQEAINTAFRNLFHSQKMLVTRLGGDHLVKLKKQSMSENFSRVLDVIRQAGNEGVDATTIASRTKLVRSEVTKALNHLTSQHFVKDTRCFTNKAKKLFILSHVQPSTQVTGGTFYTEERDIDVAFIDLIRNRIFSFLSTSQVASVAQIQQHLDEDLTQRKHLTQDELVAVLRTMELDSIIATVASIDSATCSYRLEAPRPLLSSHEWMMKSPCLSCPQLDKCGADGMGIVNPKSCSYLNDFLAAW